MILCQVPDCSTLLRRHFVSLSLGSSIYCTKRLVKLELKRWDFQKDILRTVVIFAIYSAARSYICETASDVAMEALTHWTARIISSLGNAGRIQPYLGGESKKQLLCHQVIQSILLTALLLANMYAETTPIMRNQNLHRSTHCCSKTCARLCLRGESDCLQPSSL